jgi:uncharacterized protein YecT (DUF1311 family)
MIVGVIVALLAMTPSQSCENADTTADIVECANENYRIADAEMTGVWKAAYAKMKKLDLDNPPRSKSELGYAQTLLDSQRKWIAFRDAQCRVVGNRMRGGSGQGYSTTFCLIDVTRGRTVELRETAEFGE